MIIFWLKPNAFFLFFLQLKLEAIQKAGGNSKAGDNSKDVGNSKSWR